jgi:hypothetical protein
VLDHDIQVCLLRQLPGKLETDFPVCLRSGDGRQFQWLASDQDAERLLGKAMRDCRTHQDRFLADYHLAIMTNGRMAILGNAFCDESTIPVRLCERCGKYVDERRFSTRTHVTNDGEVHTYSPKTCLDCKNTEAVLRRKARDQQRQLKGHASRETM